MLDRCDATWQPVGMVDNELAGPNPRKTGVLSSDYPQGQQRKETGLVRKALFLVVSAKASPAAALAGTPRGVGISGKKKGSEIIRALQFGGPALIEQINLSLINQYSRKIEKMTCPQLCPHQSNCFLEF